MKHEWYINYWSVNDMKFAGIARNIDSRWRRSLNRAWTGHSWLPSRTKSTSCGRWSIKTSSNSSMKSARLASSIWWWNISSRRRARRWVITVNVKKKGNEDVGWGEENSRGINLSYIMYYVKVGDFKWVGCLDVEIRSNFLKFCGENTSALFLHLRSFWLVYRSQYLQCQNVLQSYDCKTLGYDTSCIHRPSLHRTGCTVLDPTNFWESNMGPILCNEVSIHYNLDPTIFSSLH